MRVELNDKIHQLVEIVRKITDDKASIDIDPSSAFAANVEVCYRDIILECRVHYKEGATKSRVVLPDLHSGGQVRQLEQIRRIIRELEQGMTCTSNSPII